MAVASDSSGTPMKKGVKRKLSGGGGGTTTTDEEEPKFVPVVEGMSAAEVQMVKRLAGNDPAVRKKTVRKLKKWLKALSKKSPETRDTRIYMESNFMRVWKALFYCMWMADKPLPQEQLAESISDFLGIFDDKVNSMMIFIEWFYRTMAREWSLIDRYRLDKFMMLIRRFLRKTFMAMSKLKWKKEPLDGFLKIITQYVFNHQKVAQKRRSSEGLNTKSPVVEPTITCPIGLQIHITDIYLEELAKVDAEKLNSAKILKLLSPFIHELANNDDSRVTDEIKERIFHHLMKQSDAAMDYYEGLEEAPESEDSNEQDEVKDNNGWHEFKEFPKYRENGTEDKDQEGWIDFNLNGMEDDKLNSDEDLNQDEDLNHDEINDTTLSALDPRAGKVDVVLPQLEVDYEALANKLYEASTGKQVKKRNRGLLCSLAQDFREIVKGKYPLALPEEEPNTPAIPKKEIKAATRRLIESENVTPKIRLTKKQRRREAKKAAAAAAAAAVQEELNDTQGSEDASVFLNDEDLLFNVSSNYTNYVEEQIGEESIDENPVNDENIEEVYPSPSKKQKRAEKNKKQDKAEKKKKKYKTIVEVESDEIDSMSRSQLELDSGKDSIASKGKRKAISETSDDAEIIFIVKKKAKKGRKSLNEDKSPSKAESSPLQEMKTPINKNLKHIRDESTPTTTPSSSARKRVSFVLDRNSEHEATDYMRTISRSPAVPFDANKTPSSGPLLKTPLRQTPIRLSLTAKPRKSALDFRT